MTNTETPALCICRSFYEQATGCPVHDPSVPVNPFAGLRPGTPVLYRHGAQWVPAVVRCVYPSLGSFALELVWGRLQVTIPAARAASVRAV